MAARFLRAGFSDVVSFNFDRGLHLVEPSWSRADARRFDRIRSYATLSDSTRAWYPRGTTHRPLSIQIGMRKYGILIQELEQARKEYKAKAGALKASLFPSARQTLRRN